MNSFRKSIKGAVTVFVTLLIIPAMLITGTAVDISRIYTAKSIIQDINQIALNTILTQYNSMLQDAYGLYGVLKDEEELSDLVSDYLKVSLEGGEDLDLDKELKIFLPEGDADFKIKAPLDLKNKEVFKKQIEDYIKIQGVSVLSEKILLAVDALVHIVQDFIAINVRQRLYMYYQDVIFEAAMLNRNIKVLDYLIGFNQGMEKDPSIKGLMIGESGGKFTKMIDHIDKMKEISSDYESYKDLTEPTEEDEKRKKELEDDFNEEEKNYFNQIEGIITKDNVGIGFVTNAIYTTIQGDPLLDIMKKLQNVINAWLPKPGNLLAGVQNMISGMQDLADNIFFDIDYEESNAFSGLLKNAQHLDAAILAAKKYEFMYEAALEHASQLFKDNVKREKKDKIHEQVNAIFNMHSSTHVAINEDNFKTYQYEENYNLCLEYCNTVLPAIEEIMKALGKVENLKNSVPSIGTDGSLFDNQKEFVTNTRKEIKEKSDALKKFSEYNKAYCEILEQFESSWSLGLENWNWFDMLSMLYNILHTIDELWTTFVQAAADTPRGAVSSGKTPEKFSIFSLLETKNKELQNFLEGLFNGTIDLADVMIDRFMLFTYDSLMFSSYNTVCDTENAQYGENLNGVPMKTDLNYLMHSEREYLIMGSEYSMENIHKVVVLMMVARFVMNYIASFVALTDLLYEILPFPVIPEIVRAVLAVGETVSDFIKMKPKHDLKTGELSEDKKSQAVLFFKYDKKDWFFGWILGEIDDFMKLEGKDLDDFTAEFSKKSKDLVNKKLYKDGNDHSIQIEGKDSGTKKNKGKWTEEEYVMNKLGLEPIDLKAMTKDLALGKLKDMISFDYDDYLTVFQILTTCFNYDDTLERTQYLIESNVNNKLFINNEDLHTYMLTGEMNSIKKTKDLYKELEKFKTDFEIDTSVGMKMMFMSMPLFQNVAKTKPKGTFKVEQKDRRGY